MGRPGPVPPVANACLRLLERLENDPLLLCGNAGSRINHGKLQCAAIRLTRSVIVPISVNFTALDTRLSST
jgi:hypothetical protein